MIKLIATLLAFAIILLGVSIMYGVWKKVDLPLSGVADFVDLGYDGGTYATASISAAYPASTATSGTGFLVANNTLMSANGGRTYFRVENPENSGDILTVVLDNATHTLRVKVGYILEAGEYLDSAEMGISYFGPVRGIASSTTTTFPYIEK